MSKPRRKIDDVVDEVKGAAHRPPVSDEDRVDFIPSGSTLLNLAASQKGRNGGWARGRIVNLVGDGSSGKSLCALEACAQVFYNIKNIESPIFPKPDKVSIVYNNAEGVMDFPIETMYGPEFNANVEWIQTSIAEDFGTDYQNRVKKLKRGECLLYVMDSLDALVSRAAASIMGQILDDKKPDGSYGTEKAKFFSSGFFSHLCGLMKDKDATLICISQVREKIGIVFGEKHYRTGGKALDFYTHQVVWLSQVERLKRTFRTQEKVYGVKIKATFKRNKTAKPFREAVFPVLFDYGIDEIGSLVDFYFGPKAKTIKWKDQDIEVKDFIYLLDNSKEDLTLLQDMVEKEWLEIEDEVKPIRKNRWE
jgi:RecA/RadA recombinase